MPIKKIVVVLIHILFWTGLYFVVKKTLGVQVSESVQIINGVRVTETIEASPWVHVYTILFTSMVLFYSNTFYFLPKFLKAKRIRQYAIYFSVWMIVCAVSSYLVHLFFVPSMHTSILSYFPAYSAALFYGATLALSFAYFFVVEWIQNEHVKRQLREENLRTELNFLRAQVQPHFLFNVLNNLFYMARETGHQELTEGISSLSVMMRYLVYEGNVESTSLASEVKYLDHYIQLQTMKFASEDRIKFEFNKKGNFEAVPVAPFLFLPMVENAFKFGINFESESSIQIKLEATPARICFEITNTDFSSIHATNKEKSGIGLENVRKRLAGIYPGKHEFKAEKRNNLFIAYLSIDLT